jgi:integrase
VKARVILSTVAGAGLNLLLAMFRIVSGDKLLIRPRSFCDQFKSSRVPLRRAVGLASWQSRFARVDGTQPKLTFQVIRRTIATLAQKKGTVKDIQGVLRHSRTATTTDVYMQEIPESVQKTVDAISAELRLLPNLEEITRGTSVLLPNATNRLVGKFVSS